MKVMGLNKNAINLSIRVIIDETDIKEPKVIDFELFFREKQLMEKHKLVQKWFGEFFLCFFDRSKLAILFYEVECVENKLKINDNVKK